MKKKILIIEDEIIVAFEIKKILEQLSYEVVNIATNYNDAITYFKCNKPDLMIVDIHLKDSFSGIEIVKSIKKLHNIPIIFLSAYNDEQTENEVINLEPEAYLIKPFKRKDLELSIKLAMHKLNLTLEKNKYLKLGKDFIFDEINEEIFKGNKKINLTRKELQLLKILLQAKGQLVSFSTIEHSLWAESSISDSTLRTLVYRLRNKLDENLIKTIHSYGCKLNCINF